MSMRAAKITLASVLLGCAALAALACNGGDDALTEVRVRQGQSCIEWDGLFRCWDTYVPSVESDEPRPIVIDLHGHGSTPAEQRALSKLDKLADSEGFLLLYPYGVEASWNAGECCGTAAEEEIDDVGFIWRMVVLVSKDYRVDLNRVYVTGESNGCAMAQRLAGDASELVAAVACMALYWLTPEAPGYTPVAVMQIHGTVDQAVPYEPSSDWIGAQANIERWRDANGCAGEPTATLIHDGNPKSVLSTYEMCDGGVEVRHLRVEGAGHAPYLGVDGTRIDTTLRAWEFMRRFSK